MQWPPAEVLAAPLDAWNIGWRLWETWWTRAAGSGAIALARERRFNALVQHARNRSPFYRQAWHGLGRGSRTIALASLPVVDKPTLMSRFDEWVTDRAVTLEGVTAFLADRSRVGERYLDRYTLWKSSGSTGVPGIFVQDADTLATFNALLALELDPLLGVVSEAWGLATGGRRAALIAATGEHFASTVSWQRFCRGAPWVDACEFSIMEPLPALVARLNEYQPAFLASYPTMLALLAEEREAGRLRIAPRHLWSGGECLVPDAGRMIERAFGCPLTNEYGASECMSIAFGCSAGWQHVNADWVILEPVDRDYAPTPAGEPSHTVLLTNLANFVQPVIRYDLGDSVIVNPEPCACGNPLPAIRVEGRRDDVLSMHAPDGAIVRLLPLALTTVVEEAAHCSRFQIVQTDTGHLAIRLPPDGTARDDAWQSIEHALRRYLDAQSLTNVRVTLERAAPRASPRSGKLREVVAMRDARHR